MNVNTNMKSLLLFIVAAVMEKRYQTCGLVSFDLPMIPGTNNSIQIDAQGRTYVIAGNQLLRLSRDFKLEQKVTLLEIAATISLSPDGQSLLVCLNGLMDRSCAVYNSSDLSIPPVDTGISLVGDASGATSVISFSTESSFYIGSYVVDITSTSVGTMELSQYMYRGGSTPMIRSTTFVARTQEFIRTFLYGFVDRAFAYFVVVDPESEPGYRVLRVCHVTSCPRNATWCEFTALYEQDFECGSPTRNFGTELLCGTTLVDNFGVNQDPSLVVSRCRQGRDSDNNVCIVNFTAINDNMDMRYDGCRADTIESIEVAWDNRRIDCSGIAVS